MRFLFVTIQGVESEFYARVGDELARGGFDVEHLTYSRCAAARLRASGRSARSLPEVAEEETDVDAETRRIEREYRLPSIRDAYRTDPPCRGRSDEWCIARTVRHFRAVERVFDEVRPDVLVPEVGVELIRTAAHHVALARGVPTLFLFYTIFPRPLRLYVDTMDAPIVGEDELRPLAPDERAEVEQFISEFARRAAPIRAHRSLGVTAQRLQKAKEYARARVGADCDNEYLRPGRWAFEHARGAIRSAASRALTRELDPRRPFVYFPLHVTDDYKIARVIPHCADQASLVEQVADALPVGYDVVVKEHPLSTGRNSLALLRRLTRRPNVRLVPRETNSHDLIKRSAGVGVIGSTVGLEALLYGKPVLTLGRPFYAGYGLTVDVDSFAELRLKVPALLEFRPDRERTLRFLHAAMRRCYEGKPVLVDQSDENARALARSLAAAAAGLRGRGGEERTGTAAALRWAAS